MTRPDFSPAMMMLFLRGRAVNALFDVRGTAKRDAALRRFNRDLRKQAGITGVQLDMAWMGRLQKAEPRARLWAVLGHHPSDHGLVLTDDGSAAHG
ncbi:hypothetical protein [Mesorhizobium sp. CAU 1741]|uniref:hypothetical protein n=1 Tax=Mesorhizobium sp. CAU 1741 TaxID=3140366 RepID=UPI00325B798B